MIALWIKYEIKLRSARSIILISSHNVDDEENVIWNSENDINEKCKRKKTVREGISEQKRLKNIKFLKNSQKSQNKINYQVHQKEKKKFKRVLCDWIISVMI